MSRPCRSGLLLLTLVPLLITASACGRSENDESPDPGTAVAADRTEGAASDASAADSSASSADSLGADGSAADRAAEGGAAESGPATGDGTEQAADSTGTEPKRGWTARLFGGKEDEVRKDVPVPVETAAVSLRDIPAFLSSTATLEPEKDATVLAKIGGQVVRIHVEEGDEVREGAVLAELDGAEQRVGLEEAAARARGLGFELDRVRALHEQALASDKQLNDAQAAFDEAEASRMAAELLVAHTRIQAPFAGQVSARHVDPGQHVAAGRELFSVVDRSPLLARIHLPENQVSGLAPGQEIWVESEGRDVGTLRIPGTVLRIAPVVDSRTGTVKVTCQFDDQDTRLRPGSFVRVDVQTGIHDDVLAIPKRALVSEGADTYVYRAQADSVVKIPIETGFADGDWVEVVAGLSAGERIVTVGHGGLEPGTKIEDLSDRATSAVTIED